MYSAHLSKEEINHIRTSLSRCSTRGLSNELGRAKRTVKHKIDEIKETERLSQML